MTIPGDTAKPFPWKRGVVALGILLVIGFIWGATRPDAGTQKPSAANTATLAPAEAVDSRAPVTFSGDGEANSEKAELRGDYSMTFEVTGSCYYAADLKPESGLSVSVFSASDPQSGDGYVYELDGIYYLQMITGPSPACGWSVTLTPS